MINYRLKGENQMYQSEFCEVEYLKEANSVFLKWKKFCMGEDYRKPARFALQSLSENENCNFIIDARSGFEDDKEDVKWVFDEFIPKMSQTGCKKVVFITSLVNDIEGEIDMFTKAFMKYFEVKNVNSLDEAIAEVNRI